MDEKIREAFSALKELGLEPVKEAVSHRVRSPLFGGFIFSWLFFNWEKIMIVLFGDGKVIERINEVKKISDNSIIWGLNIDHTHTLWFPLIISLTFTISSPFISYILDLIHNRVITKIEGNKFDRQASILHAKSNLIRAEVANDTQKDTAMLEVKATQEISRATIAESNSKVELLTEQANALKEQIRIHENSKYSLLDDITTNGVKLNKIKEDILISENELKRLISKFDDIDSLTTRLANAENHVLQLKSKIITNNVLTSSAEKTEWALQGIDSLALNQHENHSNSEKLIQAGLAFPDYTGLVSTPKENK